MIPRPSLNFWCWKKVYSHWQITWWIKLVDKFCKKSKIIVNSSNYIWKNMILFIKQKNSRVEAGISLWKRKCLLLVKILVCVVKLIYCIFLLENYYSNQINFSINKYYRKKYIIERAFVKVVVVSIIFQLSFALSTKIDFRILFRLIFVWISEALYSVFEMQLVTIKVLIRDIIIKLSLYIYAVSFHFYWVLMMIYMYPNLFILTFVWNVCSFLLIIGSVIK